MPHLTIEYSANLDASTDMAELCRALGRALLSTGLFETGAVRVRALPCAQYFIADDLPQNAFAAMILRIGAGRSLDDKQRVGTAVMVAAETQFHDLLQRPHFALSLDIVENDPALSWKKNSIHPRLRGS